MKNPNTKDGPSIRGVQDAIDADWKDYSDFDRHKPYVPINLYFPKNDDLTDRVKPCVKGTYVIDDTDGHMEAYAIVHLNGKMRKYSVGGWIVTLLTQEAEFAEKLSRITIGDEVNGFGEIVVSINGSAIVDAEAANQAREAYRAKSQEEQKVRQKQWRQQAQQEQKLQQEQQKLQQAKNKQQDIDKRAAQYDKTTAGISYTEARSEFNEIKRHAEEGANNVIIRKRAEQLRLRCEASLKSSIASESSGKKAGAVVGGLLGLVGGPITVACFAFAGGIIGNSIDQGKETDQKIFLQVLQDLEKFLSDFPKS